MNDRNDKIIRGIVIVFALLGILTILVALAKAETKGNVKVEITDDRAVVSCVDGLDPVMKMVPRPRGGHYAVVVCERNSQ